MTIHLQNFGCDSGDICRGYDKALLCKLELYEWVVLEHEVAYSEIFEETPDGTLPEPRGVFSGCARALAWRIRRKACW